MLKCCCGFWWCIALKITAIYSNYLLIFQTIHFNKFTWAHLSRKCSYTFPRQDVHLIFRQNDKTVYCFSVIPISFYSSLYCSGFFFFKLKSKPLLSRTDLCCHPQGKDDVTGEPLIQHDDDKPEALTARLRHYKDVAKPVIDLYKSV